MRGEPLRLSTPSGSKTAHPDFLPDRSTRRQANGDGRADAPWCRAMALVFCLLTLAPSVLPAQTGAEPAAPPDASPTERRINLAFAELPKFELSCPVLDPHYIGGLSRHLPESYVGEAAANRAKLVQLLQSFRDRIREAREARRATQRVAEEIMFAQLALYRSNRERWFPLSPSLSVEHNRLQAQWLSALWDLSEKEQAVRDTAAAYYGIYAQAFPGVAGAERERVLAWFAERSRCLQKDRHRAYEAMHQAWNGFLEIALAEAGTTSTVEAGTTGRSESPTAEAFTATPPALQYLEAASLNLKQMARWWAYSWLSAETVTNASIQKSLLRGHEQALQGTVLHGRLVAAARADSTLGPRDPWPVEEADRAIRLRLSRLRARKAMTALYQQDVALEAAYTKKLSLLSGLLDAGSQLAQDAGRAQRTLVATQPIASLALAKRFLGTTLDMVLVTPLKDAAVTGLREGSEAVGVSTGWKTTAEKNLDTYRKQRDGLRRRIALLEHLATRQSYDQGMALVGWLRDGARGAPPASGAAVARTTFRDMLRDPTFIQSTDGGLVHVLEILSPDPRDQAALLLRGARWEMGANVRTAYVRIATERGVQPGQGKVDEKALFALFEGDTITVDSSSTLALVTANLKSVATAVPIAAEIHASYKAWQFLTALPANIRRGVRMATGDDDAAQERYLRDLVRRQDAADRVLQGLEQADWDPSLLAARDPETYKLHVDLSAKSFEWLLALQRLAMVEGERTKVRLHTAHLRSDGVRLRPRGQTLLAAAQLEQERTTTSMAADAAYLKFEYEALTFDFGRAMEQLKGLQALENRRRQAFGIRDSLDLSQAITATERLAVTGDLARVYEELYQTVIKEVAVSLVTTGVGNVVLSRLYGPSVSMTAETVEQLGQRALGHFNPWAGKLSLSGAGDMLWGGVTDGVKTATTQSLHRHQEAILGGQMLSEQQVDAVVGTFWDAGWTIAGEVATEAGSRWAESSVADYAGTAEYEGLVARASAARAELDARYEARAQDILRDVHAAAGGDGGDPDPRAFAEATERLSAELQGPDAPDDLALARIRYAHAVAELQEASEKRREIQTRLASRLAWVPVGNAIRRRALHAARAQPEAPLSAASIHAMAEVRTRFALGTQTMDDLELLTRPATGHGIGLAGEVLKPHLDIDLARDALTTARRQATTDREIARVEAVARGVDAIRVARVQELVDQFLQTYPQAGAIQAIIQGGAAEGNPEYQGIFGDIDFTVFTRPDMAVDEGALRQALLDHFEAAGYPLAKSAEEPSSMDVEAMVQPWGLMDPAETRRSDVILDLQEKSSDPTRFHSEAGAKWFVNNVAYSGKVFYNRTGRAAEWVRVEPGEAHGLALDMTRYLGFLTDPHYGPGELARLRTESPADYNAALERALGKSKYFLRLVDAYLIAHEDGSVTGNDLYNTRLQRVGEGDDASYHWQIWRDTEALMQAEAEGRTQTAFSTEDRAFIRRLAEMKMKGRHATPLEALAREGIAGDAATAEAERMIGRMRELTPLLLAHTAHQWDASKRAALSGDDPTARNRAFAEVGRTLSTMRNVMELDDYGAVAMMAAPDPSITDPEDRRTTHARTIAQDMERALERRRRLEADIQEVVRTHQPSEDPLGQGAKAEIDRRLAERDAAIRRLQGQAQNEQAEEMLQWVRYLSSLLPGAR